MQAIRRQAGVEIQAIHEETKIPVGLIKTFEETALFDHPQFNVVYLRSFVRSYAEMVGIDPDEAIAALELAQAGRYKRELGVKHLGLKPPTSASTPAAPSGPPAAAPAAPPSRTAEPKPTPRPASERPVPATASPPAAPAPAASPAAAAAPEAAAPDRSRLAVIGGIAAAAVLIVAILLIRGFGEDEPSPSTAEPTAQDVAVQSPEPEPVPEPVVLGERFDVRVDAVTGPVQGIRVRVDDDLRRPYWIERDSSRTFEVGQRIVLENQLSKIRLFVAGFEYPVAARVRDQRLEVTRATVQAYVDSLVNAQGRP